MQTEYLTIEQVAQLVQVEESTVRLWLERGLAHRREGEIITIKRSDLDAFLAREGQGSAHDAAAI